MRDLPAGTVTFLFTDIEGSTKLLERLGERYATALDDQAEVIRKAIAEGAGVEVDAEGDALFAAFPTPSGALRAAAAAQRGLAAHSWPDGETVRVRMGVHTGEGTVAGDRYVGMDVHLAARIAAAGHGGQVLVSSTAAALAERALPEGAALRDLGTHRLKDIPHPAHLYQLDLDGLPADFPPVRTLDARPTNLPSQRTSFVGREREVALVLDLLDQTRLLTLTGPGGTGKTRLALEAGSRLLDRFADGVFLADLSPLADPVLVPAAIAEALRVREEPGANLVDTLAGFVRDRELLLIADNFEQVTEAGPLIGRLLDEAPRMKVLVTTRVPLHLSGERELPVPPMGLPDPRHLPTADALSQFEAVALFIDRATAVRPDFQITNENAPAVAEITARLDGLPLAIELAASRVKILSPEALLARLGQRLPLLAGGARDLPERQQTLRGAIEWSHDLLDEPERGLFARLSAFSGGCTFEAAEAVCSAGLAGDVFDGLASLVDKSLLRQADERFSMLETIQEYAAERLAESGQADEVHARHSAFFLDLAETAALHLTSNQQASWLDRLDAEYDNLRSMLVRAIEAGDAETGLRVGASLWRFWQQRGHLGEGRMWLERVFALPGADRRDVLRVRALEALGGVAYWQNDIERVRQAYEEAVEVAREVGDPGLLGRALFNLSFVPMIARDLEAGERLLRESVEAAEQAEDRSLVAEAAGAIGFLEVFRGNLDAARASLEEAAGIHRELGNRWQLSDTTMGLGAVEHVAGHPHQAAARFREALQLVGGVDVLSSGDSILGLAMVAGSVGNHERAARLLGASTRIREDAGGGAPPELIGGIGDMELTASREALGEEAFERVRAEGYAMDVETATAYALADD